MTKTKMYYVVSVIFIAVCVTFAWNMTARAAYPFLTDMGRWVREGRVKYKEDITDGLENAPRELIGLLRGENFGKKIIRVSEDPTQDA